MGRYLDIVRGKRGDGVRYEIAEDVIHAIYDGSFKGACILPVSLSYRHVLGESIWVCSNDQQARRKRSNDTRLVFTVNEFKEIVLLGMQGMDDLRSVIQAKHTFGGVIVVA